MVRIEPDLLAQIRIGKRLTRSVEILAAKIRRERFASGTKSKIWSSCERNTNDPRTFLFRIAENRHFRSSRIAVSFFSFCASLFILLTFSVGFSGWFFQAFFHLDFQSRERASETPDKLLKFEEDGRARRRLAPGRGPRRGGPLAERKKTKKKKKGTFALKSFGHPRPA